MEREDFSVSCWFGHRIWSSEGPGSSRELLPSLNKVFSIIRAEEGRRIMMLNVPTVLL